MKERSSDKMNQNLDQTSHVREHEKKVPYEQREHFFPSFWAKEKSIKNYYSFSLSAKSEVFFLSTTII